MEAEVAEVAAMEVEHAGEEQTVELAEAAEAAQAAELVIVNVSCQQYWFSFRVGTRPDSNLGRS